MSSRDNELSKNKKFRIYAVRNSAELIRRLKGVIKKGGNRNVNE
jgi:hypothetical protein